MKSAIILRGCIPSLPTIPRLMSSPCRQPVARRSRIAAMGVVRKVRGMRNQRVVREDILCRRFRNGKALVIPFIIDTTRCGTGMCNVVG